MKNFRDMSGLFLVLLTFCLALVLSSSCGSNSTTESESTDGDTDSIVDTSQINTGTGEVCGNGIDDDSDGALDCADLECKDDASCSKDKEICNDKKDNDLDGKVDCFDDDCAAQVICQEDCSNGEDDDGDSLTDCADTTCRGVDPVCGEVCGDNIDNDLDGKFDCDDEDCQDVNPPCGDVKADGTICSYKDSEPHVCECADGIDNDGDGTTDSNDLQCFGPFDDNEEEFATGIPGDNEGSKADKECPFDGNSGTGNDDVCCNPTDPTQNVTPNGCDEKACCEIDVNGNTTGEHVFVMENCAYAPACGADGKHNCPCETKDNCDEGQYCVKDGNSGPGFCSLCEPCAPNEECANTCECGEKCFGGFERPAEECGQTSGDDVDAGTGGTDPGDTSGGSCAQGLTPCPGGDGDCDSSGGEHCIGGCCYPQCPDGVTACDVSSDCPADDPYLCITGCCIISLVI